jgi:glycolate oxidase
MKTWFVNNLGEEKVSEEIATLVAYSTDASQIKGKTDIVLFPTNAKEVNNIILFARRNKFKITTRGAGTGLAGGAVPQNTIVMDLSRLNNIIEINESRSYAIVEPGVILEDLNVSLKEMHFPVIPSSHKICTIGGMVATNAVGLRGIQFKRTSDWVEEVEFVDGTGKLQRTKDIDVVAGKEGTTGIITKLTLKLTPKIEKTSLTILESNDINKLLDEANHFLINPKVIGLEILDVISSRLLKFGNGHHLIIEFDGEEGDIKDPKRIEEIWSRRKDVLAVLTANGYPIIEDPVVPMHNMKIFLDWLVANKVPFFGHLGSEIIHPHFDNEERIKEMYLLVKKLKGEISGEHGIGISKKEYISPEFAEEITKLKEKYNPDDTLNPGVIC